MDVSAFVGQSINKRKLAKKLKNIFDRNEYHIVNVYYAKEVRDWLIFISEKL
jgi:hypothetical protein